MRTYEIKWTEAALREEAKKYSSKRDFKKANPGAYGVLQKRYTHIRDELFDNLITKWTIESATSVANKCSSRHEFCRYHSGAARFAKREGIFESLFGHVRNYWNRDSVIQESLKYKTKTEFCMGSSSAHQAARRLGILNELFPTNKDTYNSRCCIYIWSIVDDPNVYKVGVTSKSKGEWRINQVARHAGFKHNTIILAEVGRVNAINIERLLKKKGKSVKFVRKFTGCTEFRRFSPSELQECLELISEHTIERII